MSSSSWPIRSATAPAARIATDLRVLLPADRAWSFVPLMAVRLQVASGVVWITPGDGRDVVLGAGESIELAPSRRRIAAQALDAEAILHIRRLERRCPLTPPTA